MVKSKEDTITEFNEQVNMTAEELEKWLKNPESKKAGTGVGLESAAKIIEILKKNPTKDPSKYDDVSCLRSSVRYKLLTTVGYDASGGPRAYAKSSRVCVLVKLSLTL